MKETVSFSIFDQLGIHPKRDQMKNEGGGHDSHALSSSSFSVNVSKKNLPTLWATNLRCPDLQIKSFPVPVAQSSLSSVKEERLERTSATGETERERESVCFLALQETLCRFC